MTRIETARYLAKDPFWDEVRVQIRNDTRRGQRVFDETAFLELKYLLCVKSAWGDYKGGEEGLFGATSLLCDKLWHTFLLNTENYQIMCARLFGQGQFVHHRPVWNRSISSRLTENARTALSEIWNVEFACKSKVSRPSTKEEQPRSSDPETKSKKRTTAPITDGGKKKNKLNDVRSYFDDPSNREVLDPFRTPYRKFDFESDDMDELAELWNCG